MQPLNLKKTSTFIDQLQTFIEEYLSLNISTAFIGKITQVTNENNQARVDVQNVCGTKNSSGEIIYRSVKNIPIASIGGSVWQLSYPLKVGDTGLCIVCKDDITNFFITGEVGEIPTQREFDYGSSVFFPLALFYQPVSTEDITLTSENAQIILKPDGTVQIISDKIELGKGTLEKAMKGETFMQIFNNHVHTGNLGAPTSVPQTPMTDQDLSQEVKNA